MKKILSFSFLFLIGFLFFSPKVIYAKRGAIGAIGAAFLTKEALDATTCASYKNNTNTYVCPGSIADSLTVEYDALNKDVATLDQESNAIDIEGNAIDLYSEYAVNSYNKKIEKYQAKANQFNIRVDAYNGKLKSSCEPVSSACAGFLSSPSNIVQNESDYEASGFGVDSWIVIIGLCAIAYSIYSKVRNRNQED